jgi:hypothetical protein
MSSLPLLKANAAALLSDSLRALKPGQTIEARLVSVDAKGGGELKLPDGTSLKATLPGAIPVGSRLQLRVESGQQNSPTLKLLGFEAPRPANQLPGAQQSAQPSAAAGRPAALLTAQPQPTAPVSGGSSQAVAMSAQPSSAALKPSGVEAPTTAAQQSQSSDSRPLPPPLTAPPLQKADAVGLPAGSARSVLPSQASAAGLVAPEAEAGAELKLVDGTGLKAALPGEIPLGSRAQLPVASGQQDAATLKLMAIEAPPGPAAGMRGAAELPLPDRGSVARDALDLSATRLPQRSSLTDLAPAAGSDKGAAAGDTRTLATALNAYADAGRELSGTPQQHGHATADDIALRFVVAVAGEQRQVEVHVERDPEAEDGNELQRGGWQLRFNMNFAETGQTEARMRFQAGRLNLALWAERPELAAALGAHLDELRGDLAAAEVAAGAISVHEGRPGASLGSQGVIIGD